MARQRSIQKKIYKSAGWVEVIVSLILVVAVVMFSIDLVKQLIEIIVSRGDIESFSHFLGNAFQVIIGVEFIKMLCKHTPATVVEVLMFAIARGMVVEHSTPVENLVSIAGIAALFAIRRFLFIDGDMVDHYQEQITQEK